MTEFEQDDEEIEDVIGDDGFPTWFWDHQKMAVNTFLSSEENTYSKSNNFNKSYPSKGVIEMATGTGKTTGH